MTTYCNVREKTYKDGETDIIMLEIAKKPNNEENVIKSVRIAFPCLIENFSFSEQAKDLHNFNDIMSVLEPLGYPKDFGKFEAEFTAALVNNYWTGRISNIQKTLGMFEAIQFSSTTLFVQEGDGKTKETQKIDNLRAFFEGNYNFQDNQTLGFFKEMRELQQRFKTAKEQQYFLRELMLITKAGNELIDVYCNAHMTLLKCLNNVCDYYFFSAVEDRYDENYLRDAEEIRGLKSKSDYYIKNSSYDDLLNNISFVCFECPRKDQFGSSFISFYIYPSSEFQSNILNIQANSSKPGISKLIHVLAALRVNRLLFEVQAICTDITKLPNRNNPLYESSKTLRIDSNGKNQIQSNFLRKLENKDTFKNVFLRELDNKKSDFEKFNNELFSILRQNVMSGFFEKQIVGALKNIKIYDDYFSEIDQNKKLCIDLRIIEQNLSAKKIRLEELNQQKSQLLDVQTKILKKKKAQYREDLERISVNRAQKIKELTSSAILLDQSVATFKNIQNNWHDYLIKKECFSAFDQERSVITSIFFPNSTIDPQEKVRDLLRGSNISSVNFIYKEQFSENEHFDVILKNPFWMFVDYLDSKRPSYITQSNTIRVVATFNESKNPIIISAFPPVFGSQDYPTLDNHSEYVHDLVADYIEQK